MTEVWRLPGNRCFRSSRPAVEVVLASACDGRPTLLARAVYGDGLGGRSREGPLPALRTAREGPAVHARGPTSHAVWGRSPGPSRQIRRFRDLPISAKLDEATISADKPGYGAWADNPRQRFSRDWAWLRSSIDNLRTFHGSDRTSLL